MSPRADHDIDHDATSTAPTFLRVANTSAGATAFGTVAVYGQVEVKQSGDGEKARVGGHAMKEEQDRSARVAKRPHGYS